MNILHSHATFGLTFPLYFKQFQKIPGAFVPLNYLDNPFFETAKKTFEEVFSKQKKKTEETTFASKAEI